MVSDPTVKTRWWGNKKKKKKVNKRSYHPLNEADEKNIKAFFRGILFWGFAGDPLLDRADASWWLWPLLSPVPIPQTVGSSCCLRQSFLLSTLTGVEGTCIFTLRQTHGSPLLMSVCLLNLAIGRQASARILFFQLLRLELQGVIYHGLTGGSLNALSLGWMWAESILSPFEN